MYSSPHSPTVDSFKPGAVAQKARTKISEKKTFLFWFSGRITELFLTEKLLIIALPTPLPHRCTIAG